MFKTILKRRTYRNMLEHVEKLEKNKNEKPKRILNLETKIDKICKTKTESETSRKRERNEKNDKSMEMIDKEPFSALLCDSSVHMRRNHCPFSWSMLHHKICELDVFLELFVYLFCVCACDIVC